MDQPVTCRRHTGGRMLHVLLRAHIRTLGNPIPTGKLILYHLPVESHAGPVKFLGGLAPVPVGGEQGEENPFTFVFRKAVAFREPLELYREVQEGDRSRREVDEHGLDQVS